MQEILDLLEEDHERSVKAFEEQNMEMLEPAMRDWEEHLRSCRQKGCTALTYLLSEMWFEQMNASLYTGEGMYQEALECCQRASSFAERVYGQMTQVPDEEPSKELLLGAYECMCTWDALWYIYVQQQKVTEAMEIANMAAKRMNILMAFMEEDVSLCTLFAERFVNFSSVRNSCGDTAGAIESLGYALELFQKLYKLTGSSYHKVMSCRMEVLKLVFAMQIREVSLEEVAVLEKKVAALELQPFEKLEQLFAGEIRIMLGISKAFLLEMKNRFSEAEIVFDKMKGKASELMPCFVQESTNENAFIRKISKETAEKLKNYQIVCMEQLANCQVNQGELEHAAKTYEEVLEILGRGECTVMRIDQMRLLGRFYVMLGLIYGELQEWTKGSFYFEKAEETWGTLAKDTGLSQDREGYENARKEHQAFNKRLERSKSKTNGFFGRLFGKYL